MGHGRAERVSGGRRRSQFSMLLGRWPFRGWAKGSVFSSPFSVSLGFGVITAVCDGGLWILRHTWRVVGGKEMPIFSRTMVLFEWRMMDDAVSSFSFSM